MKRHILTIAVEDYFHVAALRGAILRKHWDRLEPRLERNIDEILGLLGRHDARGTFFVYGRIAELCPALIQRIVSAGHEVASRGFLPPASGFFQRDELVRELARSRQALEAAGANRILGYRSPRWLRPQDLWTLDLLAEHGYAYDSSINPVLRRFAAHPDLTRITHHRTASSAGIWELPISTVSLLGCRIAITGGNYIRQLPHGMLSHLVARRDAHDADPQVFYFMPWEIDRAQPHIQGISRLQRVRHYRNLGKTRWVLQSYLERYRFCSIAEHLGLALEQPPAAARAPEILPFAAPAPQTGAARGEPISIVVPMFNEATNITYLRRTLLEFRRRVDGRYRTHFVLVDDASSDNTHALAEDQFADVADCRILRHERNRGVAAAIMTGIRGAPTEIVCSIDCDGSYDPVDLESMLPLIADADMVTASPYHPEGAVINVPGWRLLLSKTLSRIYSAILHSRIHTYTSCCRIYRRSVIVDLPLRHDGFLGVAEMLIELKRAGGRIAEYPATLESRLFGESKMKVGRTIRGHLGLIKEVVLAQRTGASDRRSRGAAA
jgi:polysaccharide deacetylase family protein (PEP-CTERM system associated)